MAKKSTTEIVCNEVNMGEVAREKESGIPRVWILRRYFTESGSKLLIGNYKSRRSGRYMGHVILLF